MCKFSNLSACKGYLLGGYEIRQIFIEYFQKLNYFEPILDKISNSQLFGGYFITTYFSNRFIFIFYE